MTIFNIPFSNDGLFLLSRHLYQKNRQDPFQLSKTTVFLSTRRACRRLHSLLLENSDNTSTFLPKLIPFHDFGQTHPCGKPGLTKDQTLAKVVKALSQRAKLTPLQALPLATAFLDLEIEGSLHQLNWDQSLGTLFPGELPSHRQNSLDRLKDLIKTLENDLPIFPGALQAQTLQHYIDLWTASQKDSLYPVYGFGLHARSNLEQEFLTALATQPKGILLLSGLDRTMPENEFDSLKSPHPQAEHHSLLNKLNIKRHQISNWPEKLSQSSERYQTSAQSFSKREAGKEILSQKAFQPVFGTIQPPEKRIGLSVVPCDTQEEETRVIGLALRHLIETPDKKALLVTPDTALARSVSEFMKGYGLTPDIGSGIPLGRTEQGVFLNLVLESAFSQDIITRLSLLKHPLFRLGRVPEEVRRLARQYELAVLRSITPVAPPENLANFLDIVTKMLAPLNKICHQSHVPACSLLQAHLEVAEALSRNDKGTPLVWLGELGNLAFEACQTIQKTLTVFPHISPLEYPGILNNLLMTQGIRPSHNMHPRLLILDPKQATLQKADLVILGGLTEKNWPEQRQNDPWLSPSMRKNLGLYNDQDQWAHAAHLFTELLSSYPDVLCTWARQTSEGPQNISPFLKRLETAAACEGINLSTHLPLKEWSNSLVTIKTATPLSRPAPNPPKANRPKHLSVTNLETLQRNPYVFYAQKILKLHPLPDLQEDPGPALFGTLLHQVLEDFISGEDQSLERLKTLGQDKIAPFQNHISARYFWQTRFEEMALWFIKEQKKLEQPYESFLECQGKITHSIPGEEIPLTIIAKADRLDRNPDGKVRLIDYKSGRLPTRTDLITGLSPQLILEALILTRDGFASLPPSSEPESLEYWQFRSPCQRVIYDQNIQTLLDKATDLVDSVTLTYYAHQTPFKASHENRDPLFNHLARTQEWSQNTA